MSGETRKSAQSGSSLSLIGIYNSGKVWLLLSAQDDRPIPQWHWRHTIMLEHRVPPTCIGGYCLLPGGMRAASYYPDVTVYSDVTSACKLFFSNGCHTGMGVGKSWFSHTLIVVRHVEAWRLASPPWTVMAPKHGPITGKTRQIIIMR